MPKMPALPKFEHFTHIRIICFLWATELNLHDILSLSHEQIFDHTLISRANPLHFALRASLMLMHKRVNALEALSRLSQDENELYKTDQNKTELEIADIQNIRPPANYQAILAEIKMLNDANNAIIDQMNALEKATKKSEEKYAIACKELTTQAHQALRKSGLSSAEQEVANDIMKLASLILEESNHG